jgi:hypothetical protein
MNLGSSYATPIKYITIHIFFWNTASVDTTWRIISPYHFPVAVEVDLYVIGRQVEQLFHHTSTGGFLLFGSARYFYGLNIYSAILLQKSLFLCQSSFMVQHLTIIFREMLYNHENFATWGKEIQKNLQKI